MNKLAVVFALAAAVAASAVLAATAPLPRTQKARSWVPGVMSGSQAAPADAGDGLSLIDVEAWRLTVCAKRPADGGFASLNGAGYMAIYYLDPFTVAVDGGGWMEDKTLRLNQTAAGVQCEAFPDVGVGVKFGAVAAVPTGLTNDGGTNFFVRIDGNVRAQ